MWITERLSAEHLVILRQLTFLESALRRSPDTMGGIIETIRAPLEVHAHAEDILLFPSVAAATDAVGLIATLSAEHQLIQDTMARLSLHPAGGGCRELARRLLDLLRVHIAREEEALFPLASRALSGARLAEIDAEYALYGRPLARA